MEAKEKNENKCCCCLNWIAMMIFFFFRKNIIAAHYCVIFLFYGREGIMKQKTVGILQSSLLQLQFQTRC